MRTIDRANFRSTYALKVKVKVEIVKKKLRGFFLILILSGYLCCSKGISPHVSSLQWNVKCNGHNKTTQGRDREGLTPVPSLTARAPLRSFRSVSPASRAVRPRFIVSGPKLKKKQLKKVNYPCLLLPNSGGNYATCHNILPLESDFFRSFSFIMFCNNESKVK